MTNRNSPLVFDDIIPNERDLVKRSKKWAETLAKYESITDSPDMSVGAYCTIEGENEIKEPSALSSDYETEEDGGSGKELIPQFEHFKKAAVERNARMHQNGLDVLLNTFCLAEIEKVEKWLENHGNVFSGFMEGLNDSTIKDIRIETRSKIDRKDGDSISSVDTAKYILSNRKKGSTKVTMTTIKEFRYQKQFDIEFGQNKMGITQRQGQEIKCSVGNEKNALVPRNYLGRRSMFADKCRKRSKRNSSSDLSSTEEQSRRNGYFREKRLRRKTLSVKKRRQRSYSSSDSSSYFTPRKSNAAILTKCAPAAIEQDIDNKTADVNQNLESVEASKLHTPINQDSERNSKLPVNSSKSHSANGKIVLYSPKIPISEYPRDMLINGKIRITDKYLEGVIGCDLKEKFLKGRKSFVYECNPTSELLFSLPDESQSPSESDDDILEKLNQNKNGRILEIDLIS